MFIYRKDAAVHRSIMDARIGFFADYWLFLHRTDAHPVWCARPFGLATIAKAAIDTTNPSKDRVFRKQLKSELNATLRSKLSCLPWYPEEPLKCTSGPWPSEWLQWCDKVGGELSFDALIDSLMDALGAAIASEDYSLVAYLTRRLAGELGELRWSRGQLVHTLLEYVVLNDDFAGNVDVTRVKNTLKEAFLTPQKSVFKVRFMFAPSLVPRAIARKLGSKKTTYIFEEKEGELQLNGIEITISGSNPGEATIESLETVRNILSKLRLRYYIRTHIIGSADVSDATESVRISLPEPFWRKQKSYRKVPTVPISANLTHMTDDESIDRWNAASSHLSQAFSSWNEDPHSASSEIWQAIESFSSDTGKRSFDQLIGVITNAYFAHEISNLATFTATRVTDQVLAYTNSGLTCNWSCFFPKKINAAQWFRGICRHENQYHIQEWRTPFRPHMLTNSNVGIIPTLNQALIHSRPKWMDQRLADDLKLLYGVRNSVVHKGRRVLSIRAVDYLSRIGAEVLITIMNGYAEHVQSNLEKSSNLGAFLNSASKR